MTSFEPTYHYILHTKFINVNRVHVDNKRNPICFKTFYVVDAELDLNNVSFLKVSVGKMQSWR